MCCRFILTQDVVSLKDRFRTDIPEGTSIKPSYNISTGHNTVMVTGDLTRKLQIGRFGLSIGTELDEPLLVNVRSEGNFNLTNHPDYQGAFGIFNDPGLSPLIHARRCIIPADAYIEFSTGTKFNKPYLIYLRNKTRPFTLAGIWDEQEHPGTKEKIYAFAILTTGPNQLVARLPCQRMPVIIRMEDEDRWLSSRTSEDELSPLLRPFPAELMNGYPIAPTINNPLANDPGLIHPIGPRIFSER